MLASVSARFDGVKLLALSEKALDTTGRDALVY